VNFNQNTKSTFPQKKLNQLGYMVNVMIEIIFNPIFFVLCFFSPLFTTSKMHECSSTYLTISNTCLDRQNVVMEFTNMFGFDFKHRFNCPRTVARDMHCYMQRRGSNPGHPIYSSFKM